MREPENEPDATLVDATLRGDEAAFARLVRRYLRKAMAVALEYAGTREDAEDVVQDTFRRVFENLERFDVTRSFEPWLFTILRNCARNAAESRRVRGHEPLSFDHASPAPSPYEEAHRSQLRHTIGEAIERLPTMQRTCFRLCMVEGFSSAEAASAVGLAESTVRVHVFKARQSLQELLAAWRTDVEGG
ncbi:MAG TPA: RNA polymerase sigma factor [Gemmatimonadaceae bacterium]|nr:RNA polymerase sigma factor [Gemmatimonadaceae bacterium]